MESFNYLSVLLSIVLGLAIAQALQGLSVGFTPNFVAGRPCARLHTVRNSEIGTSLMANGPITPDRLTEYRQKGYTLVRQHVQFAGNRLASEFREAG